MLKAYVGNRTSGLLFHTSSGRQVSQRNILRDSLHPSLKGLAHVRGGFNIFGVTGLPCLASRIAPMRSSIFAPAMRTNTFRNVMKNYLGSGNTGLNGPNGSASDSRFPAQSANPAYSG